MTDRVVQRVSLTPVEIPGWWWQRHRFWVTTPDPFTGIQVRVVNERTGESFRCRFDGNRHGRGWFGVRTRWVLLHPRWKDDPWTLEYLISADEA